MFQGYPTYDRYRGLKLRDPRMRGEDVFAVQSLVQSLGHDPKGLDGIFGPATRDAVVAAQKFLKIDADGIVGPTTWTVAGRFIAPQYAEAFGVPWLLVKGQIEHESSWRGGIYSAPPRPDGSFDAGEVQMNSSIHELELAFNVPQAIEFLVKNTKDYYRAFAGVANTVRRWSLAGGAHNAPAYASWYAKQEGATGVKTANTAKPGPTAAAKFAAYVEDITLYYA